MFSFKDLVKLIPVDWFGLHSAEEIITFGNLSDDSFNGNKILKEVWIDRLSTVHVSVCEIVVDISCFSINPVVDFNSLSVTALFRCIANLIRICKGRIVPDLKESTYFSGEKCVKEVHRLGDEINIVFM